MDGAHEGKATVMMFDGDSRHVVGTPGFSDSKADYTSLALASDGTPFVAYNDSYNGGVTVMMFDGESWVPV